MVCIVLCSKRLIYFQKLKKKKRFLKKVVKGTILKLTKKRTATVTGGEKISGSFYFTNITCYIIILISYIAINKNKSKNSVDKY